MGVATRPIREGGEADGTLLSPRLRRVLVPVVLFLAVAVVYARSPVNQTTDSFWVVYTATSIIDHHDADLDEYPEALRLADGFQIDQVDGRSYYSVPMTTSLVATPMVAVALAVNGDEVRSELARGEPPTLDPLLASVLAALTTTMIYLIARGESGRTSVGLLTAGVFAFGTAAWSTASRAMWMHGPSMLAVAIAVLLLARIRRGHGGTGTAVALGAAVAAAVAARPTNALLVVAVVVWMAWTHRRLVVPVVLGAGIVGVATLAANVVLLGRVLPQYVSTGRLSVTSVVPEAIAGNLVSPSRGLLVYSPVLVLGVVGVVLKRRRGDLGSLDLLLGAVLVGHLLAVSLFPHWWGGWAFGPRFMVDVLPIAIWFLIPVVDRCLDEASRTPASTALRAAFVVLLLVSVWINWRGATSPATFAWNTDPVNVDVAPDRLWDWTDPPFLR